jgi:hypothetical protein
MSRRDGMVGNAILIYERATGRRKKDGLRNRKRTRMRRKVKDQTVKSPRVLGIHLLRIIYCRV